MERGVLTPLPVVTREILRADALYVPVPRCYWLADASGIRMPLLAIAVVLAPVEVDGPCFWRSRCMLCSNEAGLSLLHPSLRVVREFLCSVFHVLRTLSSSLKFYP